MKRGLHLVLLIAMARRSLGFLSAPTFPASSLTSRGRDATLLPTGAHDRIRRKGVAAWCQDATCRRHPSKGTSLRLSSTGSTVAPPPKSQVTSRGGGDDGIRLLTREETEAAVKSFASLARRRLDRGAEYQEHMALLEGIKEWGDALSTKRIGKRRMVLGNFKRSKLCCILAAEIVWRSGGLNRDVKICVQLIVVNPLYNKKTVGFQTVHDLESFGKNNALLLDLSPLMEVPSLRIFSLASTKTLDEDPEQVFQDPLIRQYYSRVRRSCYVLDDIPDWADLGPYWYQGDLPRGIYFFFRKRFKAVNEYEVTLRRPGPGVSTGSGTVGGARVITIDEAEAMQDVPGHVKVREIERRLSSRLLEEMQGENPVTSDSH